MNPGACARQGHSMAMLTAAWEWRKRIEKATFPQRQKQCGLFSPAVGEWMQMYLYILLNTLNTHFLY